jgi:phosphoserine phosphatase
MERPIVALIYDFDHTLSPREMQEYGFLPGIGIEPAPFWQMCRDAAVKNRMDGILAYMYMMQKEARAAGMALTRDTLRSLGSGIEFFPGVESWFGRVNAIGAEMGLDVEHYIISSGLEEIIEGSPIGNCFRAIFAASFVYEEDGVCAWPATAVNYTSKTQYLFRINKGILDVTNDRDLNAYTPEYKRRIPFSNMIYVGDGLTDVPCMKMAKLKGGYSIVVYEPGKDDLAQDMLLQNRADFALEADYSQGSAMEAVVSQLFRRIAADCLLSSRHADQVRKAHLARGANVPLNIPVRGVAEQD